MNTESEFKIIPPVPITDAILTTINVPEIVAQTWLSTTTYSLDELAGPAPVDGTSQTVYQSLQAGNINHPLTDTTWWQPLGIVYPAYNATVSYAIGDRVTDGHELYESLAASNLGNPVTDSANWLDIGATNTWAMFDPTYGSQTTRSDNISFTLTPAGFINTLYLGNLLASDITVTQPDSGYSKTISLTTHPVLTWYDWYYADLISKEDIVLTDIPPYPTASLNIVINAPSGTAKVGIVIIGQSKTLGNTQWGVRASLISYSGTTTDTFGNTTFLKRANAKRLEFNVYMKPGYEDQIFRLLTDSIDMPMLFIGTSLYETATAYAYLGAWEMPISVASAKPLTIEIKGLI